MKIEKRQINAYCGPAQWEVSAGKLCISRACFDNYEDGEDIAIIEELEVPDKGIIIVSRHQGAIEFIHSVMTGIEDIPIIAEASENDVAGKIVVGNIPLHLAARAAMVIAIEFSGAAPRGAEYTLQDMIHAGAHLHAYEVNGL